MKINYIKYKNYRCFKDLEIHFKTTKEKNISMVIAPNGGGKTEMLFSFWWVLYDFDFKKLKGKENTPYSLNSSLYQELCNGKNGENETCSVVLCFEEGDYTYIITRKEVFIKNSSAITQNQFVELEIKNNLTGETLPLKKEADEIKGILVQIIPRNILGGIIFDGERMKRLSQVDDDARKAVEGVIKQITNEELFERCRTDLEEIQKANSKKIKEYTKKRGNTNITDLENKISTYTTTIKANAVKIQSLQDKLDEYEDRLFEIHNELATLEDSRQLEDKRSILQKQKIYLEKSLDAYIEQLTTDLTRGSTLIMGKILNDVNISLENVDIPSGLNVSAVKSILKRDTCICGHEMTDEMRKALKDLIKNLPPDNINSTLMEMARQMKLAAEEDKEILHRTYTELDEKETEIEKLKNEITQISSQITDGASSQAQKLEAENQELNRKCGEVQSRINDLNYNTQISIEASKDLKKQREQASIGDKELAIYNKRDAFISKCLDAIKEIHEKNKLESLKQINTRLSEIYSEISEDVGRNLYITQFGDTHKKYRLIPYIKEDFRQRKAKLYNSGKIHTYEVAGMSSEEIDETIITQISQSNSTGQSKVNSLAFAKAIIEYSNKIRDEKSTELSKSYPFLIDSPFTELTDENLFKPAENIHTFAEQIILLISQVSLNGVEKYIIPYVYSCSKLEKTQSKTYSYLKESSNVN